LLTSEMSARV